MSRQYIKSIDIQNYRNLENVRAEFSKGINIVFGENAQGKTNFIEAVWLLSGGKSFRGSKDSEMIGFDKTEFRIEGLVGDEDKEEKIIVACSKQNPKFFTRMAKVGGGEFVLPSKIAGNFYCVIFSPVHLNIVSGGPALRRKFMDACLCQMYPAFMDNYRKYNNALNTRNTFLKNIKKYDSTQREAMFETLDTALAKFGYEIFKFRREFCEFVQEKRQGYYENISQGREKLVIEYDYSADSAEKMYQNLVDCRERDIVLGHTGAGVHREDIRLFLNDKPSRDYASQGQQRSIVIALKLAESDVIQSITGVAPVILLDDVLSELDFTRQDYLLNSISDKQVFITSCDTDRIKKSDSKKFYVESGSVKECM